MRPVRASPPVSKRSPDTKLVVIPDCGHVSNLERLRSSNDGHARVLPRPLATAELTAPGTDRRSNASPVSRLIR